MFVLHLKHYLRKQSDLEQMKDSEICIIFCLTRSVVQFVISDQLKNQNRHIYKAQTTKIK